MNQLNMPPKKVVRKLVVMNAINPWSEYIV